MSVFSKLKQLWFEKTTGLGTAAILIGSASILSRLLGVIRDRLLAGTFGAGVELDAYYAAFRLPDTLYNLLILGALSAGFIPVFSEYLERRGKEAANVLAEQVISLLGAILLGGSLAGMIGAPWFVPFLVHGFTPEGLTLTIELTRILFLSPFLLGMSAVLGGVLQSTKRFVAFSLAPVFYNVGILLGIIILRRWFGVSGVAWGVILGALIHLLAQWSVAWSLGVRKIVWPTWKSEGVQRIFRLMIPRTAGLAVSQMNLVILLSFASNLGTGSVSSFQLANNLQSFPLGVIGISFAVAAFPLLSEAVSGGKMDSFHEALSSAARKIFFCLWPASGFFLLFRAQIVRLILGDGRFDWQDTQRTTSVLGWLALSLTAQALIPLIARAFYALQETWTPFWIGVLSEAINLSLAIWLKGTYGIRGLAIAFSVGAFVQLALLWVWLRRRVGTRSQTEFVASAMKTIAASIPAFLVAYGLRHWLGAGPLFPLKYVWQVALQLGLAGGAGACVYFGAAFLVGSSEVNVILTQAKKGWGRFWA
jgi:putative peptidoglycan lipid II flippase